MLHTIDGNGNLSWHCHTHPECPYHSCADWDKEVPCPFHLTPHERMHGQIHTAHISDPGVKWTTHRQIELPRCTECGSIVSLLVHDEEDLTPPLITTDEQTGKILQVAPHPHPKFAGNLWIVDKDIVRKQIPHPTLQHLSPDQIKEMQTYNRDRAPEFPVDWMLTEAISEDIHAVYPHPAVDRHHVLAMQLKALGKEAPDPVSDPMRENTPESALVETPDLQALVQEMVTKQLQDHGVITSPKLPAIDLNQP